MVDQSIGRNVIVRRHRRKSQCMLLALGRGRSRHGAKIAIAPCRSRRIAEGIGQSGIVVMFALPSGKRVADRFSLRLAAGDERFEGKRPS